MPNAHGNENRRWLPAVLIGVLAVAVAVAAGAAYSTGVFGSSSSTDSREPSSATMQVYSGKGFSFEIPRTWIEHDIEGAPFDFSFQLPNTSFIGITQDLADEGDAFTDPAVRAFLFDTASRALQLDFQGMPLVSTTAWELNGSQGEQIVLAGTGPDGLPTQVLQTVFVHGRHIFVVAMVGPGAIADDPVTQLEYQTLLESFRFE